MRRNINGYFLADDSLFIYETIADFLSYLLSMIEMNHRPRLTCALGDQNRVMLVYHIVKIGDRQEISLRTTKEQRATYGRGCGTRVKWR